MTHLKQVEKAFKEDDVFNNPVYMLLAKRY